MSNKKEISLNDYCSQFTKEDVTKAHEIASQAYPINHGLSLSDYAMICALEMAKYKDSQLSRALVNIDEVRDDFMDTVYSVLSDDPTNDRANDIINAFDMLPMTTLKVKK